MSAEATARRVAIIGTAGRDKSQPMTLALWHAMVADARDRIQPEDLLISGGAAWADHLAVHAYLQGWCAGLELYLPAPLPAPSGPGEGPHFVGGYGTAGGAADYYHQRFAAVRGIDGRREILLASARGAVVQSEPQSPGYGAMMRRNAKVAGRCTAVLAYTFGAGDEPADGGTLATWRMAKSDQAHHICLGGLRSQGPAAPLPRPEPVRVHPSTTARSRFRFTG